LLQVSKRNFAKKRFRDVKAGIRRIGAQ